MANQEKDWEIRRMAAKVIHSILTDAGNIDDARQVAALVIAVLLNPVPMPVMDVGPEPVKLTVVKSAQP